MKKISTLLSMAAMSAMTIAQSVTTHSVYDVNQNGKINVAEPTNSHEYVDLGVEVEGKPVYWATTNIGAELPADYGLYFAWGETVGYGYAIDEDSYDANWDCYDTNDARSFDWKSYNSEICGGDEKKIKKYCTNSTYGNVDNKTVLEPEDDAAHVNWQGSWRMPTQDEIDALVMQCSWTFTSMPNSAGKSINGYKVSSMADSTKFIFLPVVGIRYNTFLWSSGRGMQGNYWTSSLNTTFSGNDKAQSLFFHLDSNFKFEQYRAYGLTIRPVCQ